MAHPKRITDGLANGKTFYFKGGKKLKPSDVAKSETFKKTEHVKPGKFDKGDKSDKE